MNKIRKSFLQVCNRRVLQKRINSKIKTLTNARVRVVCYLETGDEPQSKYENNSIQTQPKPNRDALQNKTKNENKIIDIFAAMRLFVETKQKMLN